jgi:hypothetical protein
LPFLRGVSIPRDAAPLWPGSKWGNGENRDWFHDGNFFRKRALVPLTLRPWLRRGGGD